MKHLVTSHTLKKRKSDPLASRRASRQSRQHDKNVMENYQKNVHRIIPDGEADAGPVVAEKEPFARPHNRLFGVKTLVEMKALSQTTHTSRSRSRGPVEH